MSTQKRNGLVNTRADTGTPRERGGCVVKWRTLVIPEYSDGLMAVLEAIHARTRVENTEMEIHSIATCGW